MERRLYVGNLGDDASREALRERFAAYGVVSEVQIATDRASGRARGYAFVTMASPTDAREAMQRLNGAIFEDRPLRVNEAGASPDGARSGADAGDARRHVRITFQYRERGNMTYELDCQGVPLAIRVFPDDGEEAAWRLEARASRGAGAPDLVVDAVASSRALALESIARSWLERGGSTHEIDWAGVTDALASVRAI